jgi:hypothetical protein
MIRRLLVCAALLCGWPSLALAQYTANVQLTIDNTAAGIGFTASDLAAGNGHPQINSATCTSNSSGGDFRYRVDGTAPTSSVGVLVPAGGNISFSSPLALSAFKAIRTASTSAVLSCTLSSAVVSNQFVVGPVGGGSGGGGGGVISGTVTADAGTGWNVDGTFGSTFPSTGPGIGFRAESTTPSPRGDTEQVEPWADTYGRLVTKSTDPCSDNLLKQSYVVNISSAGTVEFLNGAGAGNYIYICSINIVSAAANNILIAEDDTDNCASITAGLNGGTTAGTGWNFAANSGAAPGGGAAWIMKSAGTNRYGCLLTSASTQTSGTIVFAVAP